MKLITIMGIEIRTKESDMPGKGDSFGVCVPHQLKKGWMKVLWRWTTLLYSIFIIQLLCPIYLSLSFINLPLSSLRLSINSAQYSYTSWLKLARSTLSMGSDPPPGLWQKVIHMDPGNDVPPPGSEESIL
jgi:hypothetical protein